MSTLRPAGRCAPGLSILLLLVAIASPLRAHEASSSDSGRIEGMVVLSSSLSSRPSRYRIYPEANPQRHRMPDAAEGEPQEVENVVVYLESASPVPASRAVLSRELQIIQKGERFVPHVLPVVRGSTVEFPNMDPIFHNVFSLSRASTFDLGRYPQSSSKSVEFDQVGVVKIFCHIHADMTAVVLVLDNPYFAKPGPDGAFRIDGIPPGTYEVVAWHERARRSVQAVEVTAGGDTTVDFTIPLPPEERAR